MDCVCGHESFIRPACVHIYSTTMRLTVCQTEPQTTTTCNPKHYFPVNQQLCCLACSFHDIFSKPKNSEKNKSAHTTRKILFGLQSCVDFICFSLDSHALLFEAVFWQSVSFSSQNTSNCVFYRRLTAKNWWGVHMKSVWNTYWLYDRLSCDGAKEPSDQLGLIISVQRILCFTLSSYRVRSLHPVIQ